MKVKFDVIKNIILISYCKNIASRKVHKNFENNFTCLCVLDFMILQ